jgi:hypothetical protein
MIELSFRVFPNLKNYRVQPATHPTNRAMLSGKIRTLVGVIGMKEISCTSSKPIPRLGFRRRLLLFRSWKWNRTGYNCYTIAEGRME